MHTRGTGEYQRCTPEADCTRVLLITGSIPNEIVIRAACGSGVCRPVPDRRDGAANPLTGGILRIPRTGYVPCPDLQRGIGG